MSLRVGTKVCILLALAALAAAVYFYFVPVTLRTQTGGVFVCGSAASPPTEDFPRSVCQNLTDVYLYRSYLFVAVALVVGVLGAVMFGVDRTQVERRPRGYISEDGQFLSGSRHAAEPKPHSESNTEPEPAADVRSTDDGRSA